MIFQQHKSIISCNIEDKIIKSKKPLFHILYLLYPFLDTRNWNLWPNTKKRLVIQEKMHQLMAYRITARMHSLFVIWQRILLMLESEVMENGFVGFTSICFYILSLIAEQNTASRVCSYLPSYLFFCPLV